MKHNRIAKAVAATLLSVAAGAALADTQSLSVQAAVVGVCKFNTGQSPVLTLTNDPLGIDPSSTTSATGTVDVLYRCTNNTSATVSSAVTGSRTLTGSGTAAGQTMTYTLAFDSGATGLGSGFGAAGSDITLTVSGTITATNFQGKRAGPYAETVTLTVTP